MIAALVFDPLVFGDGVLDEFGTIPTRILISATIRVTSLRRLPFQNTVLLGLKPTFLLLHNEK